MCLCVAMSILLDEDGETFISHNIHSLIHLADECENFSCSLNKLSAFPFENFLGSMKRLVRKKKPIVQVARRISENPDLVGVKANRKIKLEPNFRDGVIRLESGKVAEVL